MIFGGLDLACADSDGEVRWLTPGEIKEGRAVVNVHGIYAIDARFPPLLAGAICGMEDAGDAAADPAARRAPEIVERGGIGAGPERLVGDGVDSGLLQRREAPAEFGTVGVKERLGDDRPKQNHQGGLRGNVVRALQVVRHRLVSWLSRVLGSAYPSPCALRSRASPRP